jgi:hypothetical protein
LEVAKSAYTLSASTKNRLQAAFPLAQRQKRAQYNIGEFRSRTQKLSPKLLGISFASGWRGKSKSDNNAIRSRRAPRAKNAHQGVVYARRRRSAQPIANKTQARNATCV